MQDLAEIDREENDSEKVRDFQAPVGPVAGGAMILFPELLDGLHGLGLSMLNVLNLNPIEIGDLIDAVDEVEVASHADETRLRPKGHGYVTVKLPSHLNADCSEDFLDLVNVHVQPNASPVM